MIPAAMNAVCPFVQVAVCGCICKHGCAAAAARVMHCTRPLAHVCARTCPNWRLPGCGSPIVATYTSAAGHCRAAHTPPIAAWHTLHD